MKKIIKKNESDKTLNIDSHSEKDSFLTSIFNNNPSIMLLVDPDNKQKILDANESALKFYEYSREQILKLDMGQINTKSLVERNKMMEKAINMPHSSFQFEHITSSGLLKIVEVKASPVEYKNKKVMFIIVHDISEQNKAFVELKKSKEQLELAMAGSNLGLWDFWVQTGELNINDRWAEMLGYSVEELSPVTYDTWKELTHVEDYQKASQLIERCYIKELNKYDCSIRMKHKDGSWVWIQDRGKVFEWSEEGKPLRMSGTHLDINDRKLTALKLAESEFKFRSYFDSSSLSLWEEDHTDVVKYLYKLPVKGEEELRIYLKKNPEEVENCIKLVKILNLNKATMDLYDAPDKESLILTTREFTHSSFEAFKDELISLYKNEQTMAYQFSDQTLTGRNIDVKLEMKRLMDNKYLSTIIDITEQKKISKKLAASEKRYRSYFESSPLSLWEQDETDVIFYLDELIKSYKLDIKSLLDTYPEVIKKCVDLVKIIDVNPATLKLYNAHSKEDLIWSLSRVFTEESYATFKHELIYIYNRETIPTRESTNKLLDGKVINVLVESAHLSDNRYIKTITDITERKSLQKKMVESESKFRSYFESSPLSLWEEDYSAVVEYLHSLPVSDSEELREYLKNHSRVISKCLSLIEILNVNKATLELYDLDLMPNNLKEFTKKSNQTSLDSFIEELISLYLNKSFITLQFQDQTIKGRNINLKLEMRLLSDYKYLVTIVDLTEIKKKELYLKELLAQTKADSETKEILLREINHRVKNSLSSFIGMLYAEKKQSGNISDAAKMDHVDSLINRVKGIGIAHELLSGSQWAPISVYKLTEKIIHSLKYLIPKDRIIDVKLNSSNIFLNADQSNSTAIIINELFSNSIEHAVRSGEKIKVDIKIIENSGTIFYTYSDSGPGYPDEILESKFKNVGMYLLKNIVEQSLRGVYRLSNTNGAKIEIEFPGGSKLEEL